MLDYHLLVDTTGSVALTNMSVAANIPANDGQSSPGVPIAPNAVLKGWGGYTTIADTLREMKLISQDQIDPINGEFWNPGAASTLGLVFFDSFLPYRTGNRQISYRQNTGAAPIHGFTLDQYAGYSVDVRNFGQSVKLPQVFGGALTANLWGSQPVSPTTNLPAGKYALLGAYVHGLTNYASIRFTHADFGGKKPGFPVVDASKAVARAVMPMNAPVFNGYGIQFMALGDIPVFSCTSGGTGLTIEMNSITADTPNVILNLKQIRTA